MRIWMIEEGEPLPFSDCIGRIMRCGILSEMLANRGHSVTWFTSDFSHQEKRRIRNGPCSEMLGENYEIYLLHADTTYQSHVSFSRWRYFKELAVAFKQEAEHREKPDIIFCGLPSVDFAREAVAYGKRHKVPVVIDVRDLWPDVIWDVVKRPLRPLVRLITKGIDNKVRYIMQNADVIIGSCSVVLPWIKQKGRSENVLDHVVYMGYDKKRVAPAELEEARDFWKQQGIDEKIPNIVFFGNIGRVVDYKTILEGMPFLADKTFRIIMCGDGDKKEEYERKTRDYDNIIYPGYITQSQIEALMEISVAGLVPYNMNVFFEGVPNKPIEYLAGGLPVLSSITGELEDLLKENEVGFTYRNGVEFAERVKTLLQEREHLQIMNENAKRLFEERFSAQKVYGELCDFMEKVPEEVGYKTV